MVVNCLDLDPPSQGGDKGDVEILLIIRRIMTLQKVNSIFKDIPRNRCDEVLIDQSRVLDGGAGMLREIRWRYKGHTFWVEYVHFEVPDRKANILLKDVIIPLKLKFKANEEGQWAAFTTIGEFLEWYDRFTSFGGGWIDSPSSR